MDVAYFGGTAELQALLPAAARWVTAPEELLKRHWDLLALTEDGGKRLAEEKLICGCGTLLLPGYQGELAMSRVRAERVISYGLSPKDSLTMSSLEDTAVLCVQRALTRPDGGIIEPQELPLPILPLSPENQLFVFGLRLLMD